MTTELSIENPMAAAPAVAFNLVEALNARIAHAGLNVRTAAAEIGVNPLAVANILNKGSKPNARTAAKFAAWLGVDVAVIAGAAATKAPRAAKAPKAPKAPKVAGAKRGRKAGGRSTEDVLAIVKAAIDSAKTAAEPHPMLKDKLALQVFQASAKVRSGIELFLSMTKHK